ncbi:2-succinyl-5-enolpyruvyl-6-hydroxy-3-cyclohexene-1-carboxylic-acid synthase [Geitlerinema sp. P-1104]|uniref:2-succinyl-5-enolpyruvyl-6-hydroxy-3- cyclohexene-1-carboxylic-acid synthase n=1 Tax=Geitlerinema sp. P-1104 TaxID=2546230 RepID=UPI0014774C1D|nr:2-succinyl-5-enolpyruvyl-6-hydroxy-3-cyclohexene-1-carboxylic-acid synthase [Geitlerinema sp. P-1104]NMG57167.1 2-succinyl-5-enolpyruvyl-6-hydroxy-3-cyclohexene-1-carboxylic-acid synthase [Geitlerinema sp. P-1104]
MAVDPRNTNTLWASVLVETLARLGLDLAVICPGSRSAPLAVAFAQQEQIEAISILDERSAAFFALGHGKRTHKPVALICTSGTAGANFYPAIIEAHESRVPLLVLTADRPPELRHCQAGQAIDQQKLYGNYTSWYSELALPELSLNQLRYLRQTLVYGWERTGFPVPGVVHLNCPFREPLAPEPQPQTQEFVRMLGDGIWDEFFAAVIPERPAIPRPSGESLDRAFAAWFKSDRGLIVAGVAQPHNPKRYSERVAQLAKTIGFPVFAEALSPLRHWASLNPQLVVGYDLLLRHPEIAAKFQPDLVLQLGDLPTSKVLRQWLQQLNALTWVLDPGDRNLDPLHGRTVHLRLDIERLPIPDPVVPPSPSQFCQQWCDADAKLARALSSKMSDTRQLREAQLPWLLSHSLPSQRQVMVANSTPVRDMEWFWQPSDRQTQVFCNRGANGIDGTLSTAIGLAYEGKPTVLISGDLAFLHDTNGLLLAQQLKGHGHLTVVLINNQGGGIFELLPIAQFNPPFQEFFSTPQQVNLEKLCAAYEIAYSQIKSGGDLKDALHQFPQPGVRVLELKSDRPQDHAWRAQLFSLASQLELL